MGRGTEEEEATELEDDADGAGALKDGGASTLFTDVDKTVCAVGCGTSDEAEAVSFANETVKSNTSSNNKKFFKMR